MSAEITVTYRGKPRVLLFTDHGLVDGAYVSEWRLKHPVSAGNLHTINRTPAAELPDDLGESREAADFAEMARMGLHRPRL